MTVLLRPANPLDAGATGEILHRFCQDTPWMPKLHTHAEAISFCGLMIDRGWMTVAAGSEGPLGFLARDGEEICSLYLAPSAQGQGIGRRLLNEAKAACNRLWLFTFVANAGAQRFYLREGFRETARSDGSDNDENLPDITYVWQKEGG